MSNTMGHFPQEHPILEKHRPSAISTKSLMFDPTVYDPKKNLKGSTGMAIKSKVNKSGQQPVNIFADFKPINKQSPLSLLIPQSNAQNISNSLRMSNSNIDSSRSHRQSTGFKRLKLKDYLRLNSISREKRSKSLRKKSGQQSQHFENRTNLHSQVNQKEASIDLQATFGLGENNTSKSVDLKSQKLSHGLGKRSNKNKRGSQLSESKHHERDYSQEIQLQQNQLRNRAEEAQKKIGEVVTMIEETSCECKQYKDLVFMFRVEEVIENCILKGIETINSQYSDHFKSRGQTGDFGLNLNAVLKLAQKKSYEPTSPVLRAHRKSKESLLLNVKEVQKSQLLSPNPK